MTRINRRDFIALGASAAAIPSVAALTDPGKPVTRRDRLDLSKSVEDNLISHYLQPVRISIAVGAQKPFSALHFSDAHVSMADAADILGFGARDLRLYEVRNNAPGGVYGLPFAVQSLAAAIAYARRKGLMMLNTGDIIDFRSEANYACLSHSLKGADVLSALGNHEGRGLHTDGMNPRNRDEDDAVRLRLEQALGQPLLVQSRVVHGVKFVAFDNCGLARYYRDEQLVRIKAEFAEGLPTVLMCHMPPFSAELHEAKCESHRKNGRERPREDNLNAYYMMGENYEKSRASTFVKNLYAILRASKNLKAILCGHSHLEWHGTFGDGVPVHLAGPCFNGECYEIEFV